MSSISVIIPVYNAEQTIHKCIDSILNQTFKDFEVIIIDDGSPDLCGVICDEYAKKDQRIKVIHKINEGVSAARQTGIDNAIGEYTIHVDPDDWIEPTELEKLYAEACKTHADMVICDFYEDKADGSIVLIRQKPSSLFHTKVLEDLFHHIHGSCCNKLISINCYKKYNVRFPQGFNYCEDQYVIASILTNPIKISYLPEAFYHYVQYKDKTTMVRKYDNDTYFQDLKRIELFSELLKSHENVKQIMLYNNYRSLVRRAFYYGYGYYDSHLFKKRFSKYSYIISSAGNIKDKFFILPACYGFYRISISFYRLLLFIFRK